MATLADKARGMAKRNDGKASKRESNKFKRNMKDMKDDGILNKSNRETVGLSSVTGGVVGGYTGTLSGMKTRSAKGVLKQTARGIATGTAKGAGVGIATIAGAKLHKKLSNVKNKRGHMAPIPTSAGLSYVCPCA